jgi:hypothetical protein
MHYALSELLWFEFLPPLSLDVKELPSARQNSTATLPSIAELVAGFGTLETLTSIPAGIYSLTK